MVTVMEDMGKKRFAGRLVYVNNVCCVIVFLLKTKIKMQENELFDCLLFYISFIN